MTDSIIRTEPNRSFRFSEIAPGREVGRFTPLSKTGAIHAVTTKGYGEFPVDVADEKSAVQYAELAGFLNCENAAWVKQVHGGDVLTIDSAGFQGEADGLVTDVPGLALLCRSADCPLIVAASGDGAIVGVAHASWRSTAAGIAKTLIEKMVEKGAQPREIVACVSPSAGPELYEVSEDVVDAMCAAQGPSAKYFFEPIAEKNGEKKWLLDLWAANNSQLQRSGVTFMNAYTARICTIHRGDLFPSYRRDGAAAGRFVAAVAASST